MSMTVEDLSRRTGVPANTIRYYTRISLLEPGRHPSNGYRLFCEADIKRLVFIGKAKWLGLSLSEIRNLIHTAEAGGSACALARTIVARRAVEVRRQIADLEALHTEMKAALGVWETLPDGPRDAHSICPIIESVVPAHRDRGHRAGVSSPLVGAVLEAVD
jgi:MerR family transcriptional regulator, Zn(II)-responsive regulator of zntA